MLNRDGNDDVHMSEYSAMIALNSNGRAMMTRDMELVRRILLAIKARQSVEFAPLDLPDVSKVVLLRHLEMLEHEKLIEAKIRRSGPDVNAVWVKDMTWDGHDLIGILENETVWGKIKQSFTPAQFATLTLSTIKNVGTQLLTSWASSQVLG